MPSVSAVSMFFAAVVLATTATTTAAADENKIADLVKRLQHADATIRLHAAAALGELGPAAHPAVSGLVEALGDEHAMVRFYAADALGEIGRAAREATPYLEMAVDDPVWIVARKADFALMRVNIEYAAGGRTLDEIVARNRPRLTAPRGVSVTAPKWPARFGVPVPLNEQLKQRAVAELIEFLSSEQSSFRNGAYYELQRRAESPEVAAQLVPLLFDSDGRLRAIARELVPYCGTDGELAVRLHDELTAQFPQQPRPRILADLVWKIMPDDRCAPQLLAHLYSRSEIRVRFALLEAVRRVKTTDAVARNYLADALGDANGDIRATAAEVVRELKLADDLASEILIPRLHADNAETVMKAATALVHAGSTLPAVHESLRALLQHEMDSVRVAALSALQRTGEDADQLVPRLVTLLGSQDRRTRAAAAKLLGEIGPEAQAAVPAIGRALNDDDPVVRAEALEALKRIRIPAP